MRFNTRGKAISTEGNLKNIELKESEREEREEVPNKGEEDTKE
jgi:hypothetical protein